MAVLKKSDFHSWEAWSPWATLDPKAEMTITGTGLGQTMTWASDNPQVGQGSQVKNCLDCLVGYLSPRIETKLSPSSTG
ncbi:MAG: hypothetical protein HC929_08995 [Leptolyngbyaceae cyanobacterium SM2_5_2]|nr:hypothetical protein [Leptolyngbyaceae cyanobacterium SM2_5_2]